MESPDKCNAAQHGRLRSATWSISILLVGPDPSRHLLYPFTLAQTTTLGFARGRQGLSRAPPRVSVAFTKTKTNLAESKASLDEPGRCAARMRVKRRAAFRLPRGCGGNVVPKGYKFQGKKNQGFSRIDPVTFRGSGRIRLSKPTRPVIFQISPGPT